MKKIFLIALTAIFTCIGSIRLNAGVSSMEEATNCQYTGNYSDYCYASDGTHNLKVLRCRPGTTSCSY
jgi:hypothetical protein